MSFSITGNLLTGTSLRPDFITFTRSQNNKVKHHTISLSTLNKLGYDFKTSIFSGAIRAPLGLIHTIAHSAIALFAGLIGVLFRHDNLKKIANYHFSEADLGLKNFGRGLIEIIPIFGSLIMRKIDKVRIVNFEQTATTAVRGCSDQTSEYVFMHYCGEGVGTPRLVSPLEKSDHFNRIGVHVRFLEKVILNNKNENRHIESRIQATPPQFFNEEL